MTAMTIYRCDRCKKTYESAEKCERHEANHYGLTLDEYREWHRLHQCASDAGKTVGACKNPQTDAEFDEAIRELCAFEALHGVQGKEPPRNWR